MTRCTKEKKTIYLIWFSGLWMALLLFNENQVFPNTTSDINLLFSVIVYHSYFWKYCGVSTSQQIFLFRVVRIIWSLITNLAKMFICKCESNLYADVLTRKFETIVGSWEIIENYSSTTARYICKRVTT